MIKTSPYKPSLQLSHAPTRTPRAVESFLAFTPSSPCTLTITRVFPEAFLPLDHRWIHISYSVNWTTVDTPSLQSLLLELNSNSPGSGSFGTQNHLPSTLYSLFSRHNTNPEIQHTVPALKKARSCPIPPVAARLTAHASVHAPRRLG